MSRSHLAAVAAALLFSWGSTVAQSPIAVFKFEDAQAAFAEQRHADALNLLADAEREFGEVNPPILYLRILVRHAILESTEKLDFDNLERLRADADHYLRVYGAVDALRTQLRSQMREVYRIQQSLSEHPPDRLTYARSLLDEFDPDGALRVLATVDVASNQHARSLRITALHRIADREDYRDAAVMRLLESELASVSQSSPAIQQLLVDLASYDEYRLGSDSFGRKDYAAAYEHFARAARSGNGRAMARLGTLYYYGGIGAPEDHEQALAWLQRGVAVNDTMAILFMGLVHYEGKAVAKDIPAARQWFERAAASGYPLGHEWLGHLHYSATDGSQDYSAALRHFRIGARQGRAGAGSMAWLAVLHENGSGVDKDLHEARRLYERAAELGSIFAMQSLGRMYHNGIGVTPDPTIAYSWFEKSAVDGNLHSMRTLGQYHRFGWAADKDYAEAVRWYAPVAETGDLHSLLAVEGLYAAGGHGLNADPARAAQWHERLFAAGGPNWLATPRHRSPTNLAPGPSVLVSLRSSWRAAEEMGPDCTGWIDPTAPDLTVPLRTGRHALYIATWPLKRAAGLIRSDEIDDSVGTTLIIRGPNGWHCNDKGTLGHARIRIGSAGPGTYSVWVGTHQRMESTTVRVFLQTLKDGGFTDRHMTHEYGGSPEQE